MESVYKKVNEQVEEYIIGIKEQKQKGRKQRNNYKICKTREVSYSMSTNILVEINP